MDANFNLSQGTAQILSYQFNITAGASLNSNNWVAVSTDLNNDGTFNQADLVKAIDDAGNALTNSGQYTLGVRIIDTIGTGPISTSTFTVNDSPVISIDPVTTSSGSSSATSNLINSNTNLSVDLNATDQFGTIADNGVEVSINPTMVFDTLQEAENFLNTFDIQASLNSDPIANPNHLKYGDNTITVKATDTYGLTTTKQVVFRINSAPLLNSIDAVAGDTDNIINAGQMNFTLNASDVDNNISAYKYSTDCGNSWSSALSLGNLTIRINLICLNWLDTSTTAASPRPNP
jgi:hypothetical protein